MLNDASIARVLTAGDSDRAQTHIGAGKSLLRSLLNRLRLGGVGVGYDRLVRPDGSVVEVFVNGGANTIVINTPDGPRRETVITITIPDFVSGAVVDQGAAYYPTAQTALPRVGVFADQRTAGPPRLIAPLSAIFEGSATIAGDTHYEQLRPTHYTGLMAQCVQAVMGFGRTQRPSLYSQRFAETFELPREREARQAFIDAHQSNEPIADFEADARADGRRIEYDFRWFNSDGLYTAPDGRVWIVKINQVVGVAAMPLPLNANTTTPEFRAFLETVPYQDAANQPQFFRDDAAIKIVETFGGFPTGRSMPDTRYIYDAYVRAGLIIELLTPEQLAPVYTQAEPVRDTLGWHFSPDGGEAHFVAAYQDVQFPPEHTHYQVTTDIGATPAPAPVTDAQTALGALFTNQIDAPDAYLYAVSYKATQITDTQAQAYLDQARTDLQGAFDAFDAQVVAPTTQASAQLAQVSTGPAYTAGFYEGGSYDYDTTLAVFYRGGERITLKLEVFETGTGDSYELHERIHSEEAEISRVTDFPTSNYLSWSNPTGHANAYYLAHTRDYDSSGNIELQVWPGDEARHIDPFIAYQKDGDSIDGYYPVVHASENMLGAGAGFVLDMQIIAGLRAPDHPIDTVVAERVIRHGDAVPADMTATDGVFIGVIP